MIARRPGALMRAGRGTGAESIVDSAPVPFSALPLRLTQLPPLAFVPARVAIVFSS